MVSGYCVVCAQESESLDSCVVGVTVISSPTA
jgi:hypothetical protein